MSTNNGNMESRFHNPSTALAVAREMSTDVDLRRSDLHHALNMTSEVAQRHGNFTEHTGVPHRHENRNGAVSTSQAQQLGEEAINGARQG